MMASMARTPRGRPWAHGVSAGGRGAAALATLLLAVGGCSPDEPDGDPPEPRPSAALRVRTVHTAGSVDERIRTTVETEVGDVLSRYVVHAFLGDYPRRDFIRAFDDFTPGATEGAASHIDVLTAAGLEGAAAVRATDLDARLSLLAPGGEVVGATAAVRFRFVVEGEDGAERTATLRGQLGMVDDDGGWSVFRYDVALDDGVTEAEVTS